MGSAVDLAPGPNNTTSTASSVPFTPNAPGYWCLAEHYAGDSNYSSHRSADTASPTLVYVEDKTEKLSLVKGTSMDL